MTLISGIKQIGLPSGSTFHLLTCSWMTLTGRASLLKMFAHSMENMCPESLCFPEACIAISQSRQELMVRCIVRLSLSQNRNNLLLRKRAAAPDSGAAACRNLQQCNQSLGRRVLVSFTISAHGSCSLSRCGFLTPIFDRDRGGWQFEDQGKVT